MASSLRVGNWVVDPDLGTVSTHEEKARLEPRSMQVLLCLAEHAGEVVSKEAIFEEVWQGVFVTDEALTNCISNIRRTLHDDAKAPELIKTIPRKGYQLIAPVRTEPSGPAGVELEKSPYPGLASFSEEDADRFFGREREVELLRDRMARLSMAALIGPSGVGKSSLLRAGLVPSLTSGWRSVVCRPGDRPLANLARALAPEFLGDAETTDRLFDMDKPEVARNILARWRSKATEALLVVDQFEELFALNPRDAQERFAALLGEACESGVRVLVALRDDFLMHCHRYVALAPVFTELTPLGPPSGDALKRALVEPARALGFEFEEGSLVDEMVREVSAERGALPLLAFTASQLWQKRDQNRRRLTCDAYREIGGVGGAFAQHAEATLERIGAEGQDTVRELFRNLTTAKGTRASRTRQELLSLFGEHEDADKVLQELIGARLLTAFEDRIEIIHESLLEHWPRLVQWQAQDVDGAQLRDQLRQAARLWEERGRPDDLLWSGRSFQEYRLWRQRYPGALTAFEEAFAHAMTDRAQRRKRRRRLALVAAFALLLGVLAVVGVSRQEAVREARRAEASKLLALAQLRHEEDPTEALAFTKASLEMADSDEARIFAMRLLWEAPPAIELAPEGNSNRVPRFSPDGSRLAVAGHSAEVRIWRAEGGDPPLVLAGHLPSPQGPSRAFWASNELLVTKDGGPTHRAHIWAVAEGERLRTIDFGGPTGIQVGPDTLFAETREGPGWDSTGRRILRLRSWRLPDGEARELGRVDLSALGTSQRIEIPDWARLSLFAPDGSGWLYTRGGDIYLRPLPSGTRRDDRLLGHHPTEVTHLGPLSDDSLQVSSADRDGGIRIWDFSEDGPKLAKAIPRHEGEPETRFPDPSGRWGCSIVSAATRGQPRVWKLNGWPEAHPLSLRRSGSWQAASAGLDPSGDWLVASTRTMARLTFWPLRGEWPSVVDGNSQGQHRPLAFSPDGRWLATDWTADSLRLWPLPGNTSSGAELALPDGELWFDLVFDPRGRFLFVVGSLDLAYIVPLDGSSPRRLEGFSKDTVLVGATVSPSGRRVATAFLCCQGSETLRVWDVETGERRLFELPEGPLSRSKNEYGRGIMHLAFADESTLYTAGDGGVRRWDLESGAHELLLATEPGYLVGMAFALEGRKALLQQIPFATGTGRSVTLLDLSTGVAQELPQFGTRFAWGSAVALDASGAVAATGDEEGIVRVGRVQGGDSHLLVGHEGAVTFVAISPDLRWIASSGEDETLRLWPMPDLSKPPLHTLPQDELIAKLKSLTNIRVVRDPESEEGWKVALDPFPGWKEVPSWR